MIKYHNHSINQSLNPFYITNLLMINSSRRQKQEFYSAEEFALVALTSCNSVLHIKTAHMGGGVKRRVDVC